MYKNPAYNPSWIDFCSPYEKKNILKNNKLHEKRMPIFVGLGFFFLFLIVAFEFLQELGLRFHHIRSVTSAVGTEPLALRFGHERHAAKVEPLDWAQIVITQDHLAEGYLKVE